MSVIIKGMDMPSSCANCNGCVNIGVSRYLCVLGDMFIDDDTQIDPDCPLVEIPKNHGRLIDADNANEVMAFEMSGTGHQAMACSIVKSDLYTPTILDAEGDEE